MALSAAFTRGKDVTAQYRQNGQQIVAAYSSIKIDEQADSGVDDVNGEDRSRPYIVTNYFTITLEGYTPDLVLMQSFLADIANEDARVAPLDKAVGFKFKTRDGLSVAFRATSVTRGPLSIDSGSRTDPVKQSFSLLARYFDQVVV